MVPGLSAPADHERRLRDSGVAARAVRGDDFENCFTGKRYGIGHGPTRRRIVARGEGSKEEGMGMR